MFLRFKLSNRRLCRSTEIRKARRKLLDTEIRSKEKHLSKLSKLLFQQRDYLKSAVRSIDYVKCRIFIDDAVSKLKVIWYNTHRQKFIKLRFNSRTDAGLLCPDSVITNLSDYPLSEVEKLALANGLKFSLPPSKLKSGSYLANFEILYQNLSGSDFKGNEGDEVSKRNFIRDNLLVLLTMSRRSLLNIPRDQYNALLELSKNEDIIITCPDKGSGIVILNKADYIKEMEEIVADTTKFKVCKVQDLFQISRKIERKVRTTLLNLLKKPGHLTDDEYKRLYPNGSHIGVLYGLPKVHKPNVPTRPICSMVGTSTYELGKYIADIIKPAAASSLGTDLINTFQFVEQIGRKDLSDVHMISFDVKSLFTNIPLNKTIKICLDRLYWGDPGIRPSIPEDTLKKLLELCVCDNTFVFNGKVWKQVDGVAMGSSLSPLPANIYMARLEEEFYFKESRDFSPTFYRRYVDDTFCIFKKLEHADQFMSFVNTVDPSIQFDMELEVNSQLPFLDTVVKRNDNNVFPDISMHVKPTDKRLFYNFNSFIPDRYKYNLMCCLIHQVYHIASSFTIFHEDLDVLRTKFLKNGFPLGLCDNTVGNFLNKQYLPDEKRCTVPKRVVTMVLSYLGPLSIVIRRHLRRLIVK